jgi:AmmeMemoRadiSam system protein A
MLFEISPEDRKYLLDTAKKSVQTALAGGRYRPEGVPETLQFKSGCFVTLHLNGTLRGCIGNFRGDKLIADNVAEMAVQAATQDPRFSPVSAREYEFLEYEISVLSPMIPIKSVEEAEVGRDGLYVIKGYNRGVLLPQVATEYNWDKYEFISHACAKAGLPYDAWKNGDIELFRFEAVVFGEKDA